MPAVQANLLRQKEGRRGRERQDNLLRLLKGHRSTWRLTFSPEAYSADPLNALLTIWGILEVTSGPGLTS